MRTGKLMLIGLVVLLLVCSVPVAATADGSNNNKNNENKPTMIVEYGTGKDLGLIKVTHIDYAKSESKTKPPQSTSCYKLAKWRWSNSVTYTLDSTAFPQGSPFESALAAAMAEWDFHSSKTLFNSFIKGSGTANVRDGKNLITFGNYPQDGVIAVTYTWYNPGTRLAVESDMLFDNDFTWDTSGDPSFMDVQNIATHEMGHTLGLSDLYTASCNAVTMYGYSTEGDIEKRTLDLPDIAGLRILYGA